MTKCDYCERETDEMVSLPRCGGGVCPDCFADHLTECADCFYEEQKWAAVDYYYDKGRDK